MWKTKLCLGLFENTLPFDEQITLFKAVGFEGFFVDWYNGIDLQAIRRHADSVGMYFQSVHAPFGGSADMWRGGEKAERALNELLVCLDEVAEAGVDIMVCHAWIGFYTGEVPTQSGVDAYRILAERAKERGVMLAFENTEGEEFLDALLKALADFDNVGFCLDTGHEMCYNHSQDLIALYGDRLVATHVNDNLGIRDYGGRITYLDDLHLLPFDGIADWMHFADRIALCRFDGPLTFELGLDSKPNRHENDPYRKIPFEQYVTEAYKRACRVAALVQKARQKSHKNK